jgi:hypothetical protein
MLWVQLNQCRLGDKKARKLSEALRTNTAVTSIDLSHNQITDNGVEVRSPFLLKHLALTDNVLG